MIKERSDELSDKHTSLELALSQFPTLMDHYGVS